MGFRRKRACIQTQKTRDWGSHSGFDVTDDVKVWTVTSPIHKPTVCLVWLRPCRSLVTASMENSGNHKTFIVSIIDDVTLADERANAFAELWPVATHARLFDEQLESIEDGVNESVGGRRAGILGNVGPDLFEVALGERG
jgi:hypothetical protein